MRIVIKTDHYNENRYCKPWIGKVVTWKKEPGLEDGLFIGKHGYPGILEIDVEIGDLIKKGQIDKTNPKKTEDEFYLITEEFKLKHIGEVEAREYFLSQAEKIQRELKLSDFSNQDLIKELKSRGLKIFTEI